MMFSFILFDRWNILMTTDYDHSLGFQHKSTHHSIFNLQWTTKIIAYMDLQ